MSNYPDFITARNLEGLREFATDEEIIGAFSSTLVYARWELGKAVYELWCTILPEWVVIWMYNRG